MATIKTATQRYNFSDFEDFWVELSNTRKSVPLVFKALSEVPQKFNQVLAHNSYVRSLYEMGHTDKIHANGQPDHSRHDMALATYLAGEGYSPDEVATILSGNPNSNLSGKPERELQRTVENAFAWVQSRPNTVTGPNLQEPNNKNKIPYHVIVHGSLPTFLSESFPERESLWGDHIIDLGDKVLAGGPPKVGKSWFAIGLGLAIANGEPYLGIPTRKSKVLYVQAEINERHLQRRINLKDGFKPDDFYLFTARQCIVEDPEHRAKLLAEIEKINPDLVILDPLKRFHRFDENSQEALDQLIDIFNNYFVTPTRTLMVLHHTRKTQKGEEHKSHESLRGSGVLVDWADSILVLDKPKDSHVLSFTLRNTEEPDDMKLKWVADPLYDFVLADDQKSDYHTSPLSPAMLQRTVTAHQPIHGWPELARWIMKDHNIELSRPTLRERFMASEKSGLVARFRKKNSAGVEVGGVTFNGTVAK